MPNIARSLRSTVYGKNHAVNRQLKTVNSPGFTLVELIIVIAIISVLATVALVAINPIKRAAQARDSKRKSDVNAIANALVGYFHNKDEYPSEKRCDTSKGININGSFENGINIEWCDLPSQSYWQSYSAPYTGKSIVEQLVDEGFLKRLPTDPKNNSQFYYKYEPSAEYVSGGNNERYCSLVPCQRFWIGARMEAVDDPAKKYKIVFRCSNDQNLAAGIGCKEVEFLGDFHNGTEDVNSFDASFVIK